MLTTQVTPTIFEDLRSQLRGALLEPFASGKIMPNFLNGDEGVERDRTAHPGLKQMHLAMLKARFDPTNILRFARTPGSRPV